MIEFVEIGPGQWVNPSHVTCVQAASRGSVIWLSDGRHVATDKRAREVARTLTGHE